MAEKVNTTRPTINRVGNAARRLQGTMALEALEELEAAVAEAREEHETAPGPDTGPGPPPEPEASDDEADEGNDDAA